VRATTGGDAIVSPATPGRAGLPATRRTAAPREDAVGVLSRTAVVLSCFDSRHPRLTLSGIVRRSGLPKTTVHRLLAELCRHGLLSYENHEYNIGQRIFELASLSPLTLELREIALPYMQDLYSVTEETVHLGIRDGHQVLYVDRIRGHREITPLGRIGSGMPLYCTALGKALLSHCPPSVVDAVVAEGLRPRTRYTITSSSRLRRELADALDRGIAYDREEAAIGLGCVAAPVLDAAGAAVAALSVSVPIARRRLDELASAVRTATLSISRLLGRRRTI
jgi:DNA-binding IclR family transcriptional regulator